MPELGSTEDVTYEREQLEFKVDAFLRNRGWKSTSNTPGCYWLWERKLEDGRVALVNKELALSMERQFEAWRELEKDEEGGSDAG